MLILAVLALAACLSGALAAALFTEARRRRPTPGPEAGALLYSTCQCLLALPPHACLLVLSGGVRSAHLSAFCNIL